MNPNTIRVLDVETTGLDPKENEIIEIAIVHINIDSKELSPNGASLFKPSHPIPAEASAVNHITDEMVAGANAFEDERSRWLPDDDIVLCSHNAKFDKAFTKSQDAWIDTKAIALHLWPEAPKHTLQFLRYWLRLNIPIEGVPLKVVPHRAYGDAIVAAHLLLKEIEVIREKYPSGNMVEGLLKLSQMPAEQLVISFGKHKGEKWSTLSPDYLLWMAGKDFSNMPEVAHTLKMTLQRRGLR